MSEPKKRPIQKYTRYSGLAYQLIGLLAVAIFAGLKADAYFAFENNYLTALFCVIVLFAFFYKIIHLTSKM